MREFLRSHGITPTAPRIRIWQFLHDNKMHPTAEEVYRALEKEGAHLSRATVYNTLNLFAEKNLLRTLRGDDDRVHFDPFITPHAHFQCECCHTLWNLPLSEELAALAVPDGFTPSSMEVVIRGRCPHCQKK